MRTSVLIRAGLLVGALTLGKANQVLGAPTSVSYTTTFSDAQGTRKTISFQGTADGASLTGTLDIGGDQRRVEATIAADGSVAGRLFRAGGTEQVGLFWGTRVGNQLKGSFDLRGEIGEWSVPASKLPPLPKE